MFNDWFKIGSFTIHGYGVMIAIGILAAFFVAERQAKKHDLDPDLADTLIFVVMISGFLCSKITFCLINWNEFIKNPRAFLGADGWVVYGGIIGGFIGSWIYCKIKKIDFLAYFNLLLPEAALAQGFGRIGCFFAGCCYGKPTDQFGVVFPPGSLAPSGVRLIPTQLISAFGDFLLFYILYRNYEYGKHPEETGAWYLILYSIGRFLVEFLRGDEARGSILGLSTSQFIALFVCALGVAILLMIRSMHKNTPQNTLEV
jgi:phosphatidylglycerol:prolipoprotein diacylglycerol transferase